MDKHFLKGYIKTQYNAGVPADQIIKNASILMSNELLNDPHIQRGFEQVVKSSNVSARSITPDLIAAEFEKRLTK